MRLHYSDMKKRHCQDGENKSAPILSVSVALGRSGARMDGWTCGGVEGGFNCLRKKIEGAGSVSKSVCACVCVRKTTACRLKCTVFLRQQAAHLREASL